MENAETPTKSRQIKTLWGIGNHRIMSYSKLRVYYYDSNRPDMLKKITVKLPQKFVHWAEVFSYNDISLKIGKYDKYIDLVDVAHVGFTQWSFQVISEWEFNHIRYIDSYEWL